MAIGIKCTVTVISLSPGLATAHYHLGLAHQRAGRLADAAAAFEATLRANPRHVRARATLGLVLQADGRTAAAAAVFDHDRLVAGQRLTEVAGFDDVAAFNRALAAHVLGHRTLMWNRPSRSTVAGSQTLDIAGDDAPVIAAFRATVDRAVRDYLDRRLADGPDAPAGDFFATAPSAWDLVVWGVVLKSSGHQSPHNHASGLVSGVYYVAIPDIIGAEPGSTAGFIEFGVSNVVDADGREMASANRLTHRPVAGEMVLFPSYFWHRTIPFEAQGNRISVAFDVIAR